MLFAKTNNQITAPELRVLDEKEENLGIFPLSEALRMAQERGVDLIEIVPSAKPPIAKIMSFDKYRYQREKELKKQRLAERAPGMKQVRISVRAARNDLEIKAKKVNEFLGEGHRVEIMLALRGREKGNKAWGEQKIKEFLTIITPDHKVVLGPKEGGRGFIAQVTQSSKL